MLPDEKLAELSEMQMEQARSTLSFIPTYIAIGDYKGAVNRAYYAAFHALKALEVLDKHDAKKHSGVIAYFRQMYIKTGLLDVELSKIIGRLQDTRESGDYDITATLTLEDAQEQYDDAVRFVAAIQDYLTEHK